MSAKRGADGLADGTPPATKAKSAAAAPAGKASVSSMVKPSALAKVGAPVPPSKAPLPGQAVEAVASQPQVPAQGSGQSSESNIPETKAIAPGRAVAQPVVSQPQVPAQGSGRSSESSVPEANALQPAEAQAQAAAGAGAPAAIVPKSCPPKE